MLIYIFRPHQNSVFVFGKITQIFVHNTWKHLSNTYILTKCSVLGGKKNPLLPLFLIHECVHVCMPVYVCVCMCMCVCTFTWVLLWVCVCIWRRVAHRVHCFLSCNRQNRPTPLITHKHYEPVLHAVLQIKWSGKNPDFSWMDTYFLYLWMTDPNIDCLNARPLVRLCHPLFITLKEYVRIFP